MTEEHLRTSEVARLAGVNVETLRYYERRGLLSQPRRTPGGYREYEPETVRILRFVKRAQQLGFTLREIQELLELRADRGGSCSDVRTAAREKTTDIDVRVRQLLAMKDALEVLIRSCRSDRSRRDCPILEALDDASHDPRPRTRRKE